MVSSSAVRQGASRLQQLSLLCCKWLVFASTSWGQVETGPAVQVRYATMPGEFYQLQKRGNAGWDNVGFAVVGSGELVKEYHPVGEYRIVQPKNEWVLVWADEFSGTDLDYGKWEKEENN
jgi:hypothetical protein